MNRVINGSIKCSFGQIATRHWNKDSGLPKIFMMHGWQDHLGIFERLNKMLCSNYEIFAWDMPGHGWSDYPQWPWTYGHHEHPKQAYEILERIKWDEFSLVAHSWAGNGMTPFVCMFPDRVQNYIILDAYGLITSNDDNFLFGQKLQMGLAFPPAEQTFDDEAKMRTREELKKRIMDGTTIPHDFVDEWMERGVRWNQTGQMGAFSRDIRMTTAMIIPAYNSVYMGALLERLETPTLKLNGTDSQQGKKLSACLNRSTKSLQKFSYIVLGVAWNPKNSFAFDDRVLEWQNRLDSLENVTVKTVTGNHHFFIDNYKITSKLIHDFIDSNK